MQFGDEGLGFGFKGGGRGGGAWTPAYVGLCLLGD